MDAKLRCQSQRVRNCDQRLCLAEYSCQALFEGFGIAGSGSSIALQALPLRVGKVAFHPLVLALV